MSCDTQHRADFDHLRFQLETRRRQLLEDLRVRLSRIRQVDPRVTASREADDEDVSDIDVGVVDIMTATLRRIDAALDRIADGGYGRCARCNAPIGEARLRAMPFAVCCKSCEANRERDWMSRRKHVGKSCWGEEPLVRQEEA